MDEQQMDIHTSNFEKNNLSKKKVEDSSDHSNKQPGEAASEDYSAASEDTQFVISKLEEEVAKLKQELFDAKDKQLRALAESDNMRRRLERERGDLIKFANENLLKDLMPVLDGFEKAVSVHGKFEQEKSSEEANSNAALDSGIQLVFKHLTSVLEKFGLKGVESVGKPFDPNLHQAIQKIESSEVQEELVKDEFAKGYLFHERLIRPAIVSVVVPSSQG